MPHQNCNNTRADEERITRFAVKGCIFKDGKMLILHKPEKDRLKSVVPDYEEDLPGGCIDSGESFQEALAREIYEETALEVEIRRPFEALTMRSASRTIYVLYFVCAYVSGDVTLSWEHESYEWFDLEQIKSKDWKLSYIYEDAFSLIGTIDNQ